VLSAGEVAYLVEEKLRPMGLVTGADGTEPEVKRSNPLLALRFRFVVTNPRVTNAVTRPFAVLFHPALVAVLVTAFVGVTAWTMFEKGLGGPLHQALYDPKFLLLVFVLTIASAGFHEFGHAAACRYGGATPGAMGAALYLVWPAFYTDVSDSYRLDRAGRLRVDLGGLFFNAIFAVATFLAWAVTGSEALLVMVPIQLFQMLRQLLPLVRFDGYHILADLTGVPDLFARIKPTLLGLLPKHWGSPETKVLRPWARVVVSTWVLLVVPALAACLVLLALGLPRLMATAFDSLRLQYGVLQENVADGDLANIAVRVLSLVMIALPPLSVTYLLTRITRRTSTRMWNAAGDHPLARGAAATAIASVVVFAALAMWPGGQYEPVTADELIGPGDGFGLAKSPVVTAGRAVVEEIVPRRVATARAPSLASAKGIRRGAPGGDELGGADGSTASDERLHLRPGRAAAGPDGEGAVASSTSQRAAWPFPFAPPPAPGAHDNFAVAVNTVDGARVAAMETSFAWLDTDRVDHRNRSYALASCLDCTTVATAFQVVVANGSPRTVVPENTAVAINYECTTCVTHSIAVQLVVTTKTTPPADVRRQVESRFRVAEALEQSAQQLSAGELRSRLHGLEAEILDLLAPYTADVARSDDTETETDGDEAAAADAVATGATPTTTTSAPSSSTTSTSTTSTTTPTSSSSPPTTQQPEPGSSTTSTSTTTTDPPPESTTTTTEPPTTSTTTTT
jgi:putative peptide zinc metalloprotease protein